MPSKYACGCKRNREREREKGVERERCVDLRSIKELRS